MTGAELKAFRVERGWSQAKLALAICSSENSVSTWERLAHVPGIVVMAVECLRYREEGRLANAPVGRQP